jgi:hypothetical protein
MKSLLVGLGWGVCVVATGACFFRDDDPEPEPPIPPECVEDAECAHLDDGDPCYAPARCDETGTCDREFLQNADDCQCDFFLDCFDLGYEEQGCNEITCDDAHQCGEIIAPEGPAPDQTAGDCKVVTCDGDTTLGVEETDALDVADDNNPCTADTCGEMGAVHEVLADGEHCLDGSGICYAGLCYPGCVPTDPESCGGEGPSEPLNDTSPSQYGRNNQVCGMLDEDDIDWFELYLVDEELETDILGFDVHSSAATVELCAYVLCNNYAAGGYPEGGCANKVDGPNGSVGCCWTGAPEALDPSWDLNCTDTNDDAGTMYFSVRTLGGDACDTYTISAHY